MIEELPFEYSADTQTLMDDLEYFSKKLLVSLAIPRHYLYPNEYTLRPMSFL